MAFKDLNDFLDPLVLPIGGKNYTVPPVSMEDGLRLQTEDDIAALPVAEFRRIFIGDALLQQLIADGISAAAVSRVAMTALTDYLAGRDAAEVMWETGGDPKALTEWQNSLPTVAKLPAAKRSRKPAGATTTKPRASGTGTKTSPAGS